MKTLDVKKKRANRECGFQPIPHWNDPEIGYKALLKCIRIYVKKKDYEFERLAPVITRDEFIWDTFSNICRRNGYPQYDKSKNKGNFYSFVETCCRRNQADWARKRNVQSRQLAEAQGAIITGTTEEFVEGGTMIRLDDLIEGSDDQFIHEKIEGSRLSDYTYKLAMEDISKNISDAQISEKFNITWKEFAQFLMTGWSIVDLSKRLEVNPTTTRKYCSQLKEKMLQDSNIRSLMKLSGMIM